ncbi:MAG: peptidoglycan editing factor PgeF [Myxococcaceae bacterium]
MPELFLTSRRLPVRHGFSVRGGGVSEGPWASLNLGFSVGDEPSRVEENLKRLARAADVGERGIVTVSQVHGDTVRRAAAPPERIGAPPIGEADAVWTDHEGVAVGIRTADCVPILLVDEEQGRVAAVHSGWRGTDLRIVQRAVEVFAGQGSMPGRLLAAVGPAIQACCYEVSEELAHRFESGFGPGAVRRSGGRPHLDLAFAVKETLRASGVPEENVDVLPHCTACDDVRFFSHRRDRGVTGRHLSFVTP